MDADRAIAIIETVLAPASLSPVQVQIVRGAIARKTYQEMIAAVDDRAESWLDSSTKPSPRYKINYIKETGANLWQSLSLKFGKKVTKTSLAAVLLWYSMQPELSPVNSGDRTERSNPMVADWGEGIQRPRFRGEIDDCFYGRTEELATLTSWCIHEGCRLISLIGMGGMGKTTLVWRLAHQVASHFDLIIWRSLFNAPLVKDLCADLIRFLSPQPILTLPDSVEGQIELLIACLTRDRTLMVLDNVESILQGQVQAGQYLPGYDGYGHLFKAIGELPHQSCLILASREQPHTIPRSQIVQPQLVRSITLAGMTANSGHQLIQAYGCPPLPAEIWQHIYTHYGGNPLALKIAAITAVELTGGDDRVLELYPLIESGELPDQDIDDILHRQFERLSAVEQQLVYWLAIEREPMTGARLRSLLVPDPTVAGEMLNALQSLLRRCIAIRQQQNWSLCPAMIAYVTKRSHNQIVKELAPDLSDPLQPKDLEDRFTHLNTYAIIKVETKDYLRQIQIQSIFHPILDRLLAAWGSQLAFRQHLGQILRQWQSLDPIPPGYLAENILNLLVELEHDRE